MGFVRLNLHASPTTVALLSPPQVAIDEFLVDFQARRQARQECDQSFAMGLPGGEVAQHKRSILNDDNLKSGQGIRRNQQVSAVTGHPLSLYNTSKT